MRSKELETTVYFVRHGQTDFPTKRIYCDDREDPQLNETGLAQAAAAASYFAGVSVDKIIASPAMRTLQTAGAIERVTGKPIQTDERLRERRFGAWEGLYFDEIETQYPREYSAWKQDQVNYTPHGGETIHDLVNRLNSVVSEIVSNNREKTVVVVTHVGPIRTCVTSAFEIPVHQYRQIRIDYASITRIDYGEAKNNLINLNIVRYI